MTMEEDVMKLVKTRKMSPIKQCTLSTVERRAHISAQCIVCGGILPYYHTPLFDEEVKDIILRIKPHGHDFEWSVLFDNNIPEWLR